MSDATQNACPMQHECARANEERWKANDDKWKKDDAFKVRYGEFKDETNEKINATNAKITKCESSILKSRNYTAQLSKLVIAVQKQSAEIHAQSKETSEQTKEYMRSHTEVLDKLADNLLGLRESLDTKYTALFDMAVTNSGRTDRAISHAEQAAMTALGANTAAEKAATNLTTMTRATLALVILSGSLAVTLISQYGLPWLFNLIHSLEKIP